MAGGLQGPSGSSGAEVQEMSDDGEGEGSALFIVVHRRLLFFSG